MSDHDKDVEILSLRHQIMVLQRQMGERKLRCEPADRRFWPRCCTGCRATSCPADGCWCTPTPSCAGTATWSPAGTQPSPDPTASGGCWSGCGVVVSWLVAGAR
jgi:hypothetical protein